MSLGFYLDGAKKLLDTEVESVLARKLGITPQQLYRMRNQGWCTDEVLEKLADMLDVAMEELVLAREATKPHHEVIHAVWQRCYDKYAAAAGSLYYRKLSQSLAALLFVDLGRFQSCRHGLGVIQLR